MALSFLQSLSTGKVDLEYLSKNCTEKTVELFSEFGDEAVKKMKGASFRIAKAEVNGDKAIVTFEQRRAEKVASDKIVLVKVDGAWRVDAKTAIGGDANGKLCVMNMRQISNACDVWQITNLTPPESVSDLVKKEILKSAPECPCGGNYEIDKNGNVICTSGLNGHVLPK